MNSPSNQPELPNPRATWATNLSVRALAVCISVWLFTSSIVLLHVPFFYPMLEEPELRLRDQFFAWRSMLKRPPETAGILLITIDDESIRRLGAYPPWPGVVYASILERLKTAGVSLVGMDFVLDGGASSEAGAASRLTPRLKDFIQNKVEPSWEPGNTADDQRLLTALRETNLVLPAMKTDYLPSGHVLKELFADGLSEINSTGDVALEPDFDGIVRRASLVTEIDGQPKNSFALRLAEKKWGTSAIVMERGKVCARGKEFPTTMTINFAGPEGTFPSIPFWRILEEFPIKESGEKTSLAHNELKNKVVLIGFQRYGGETTDWTVFGNTASYSLRTPLSNPRSRMSGLELQANILANLVTNRFLTEPSPPELVLVLLLCSGFFGYLFRIFHGRPWWMLGGVVVFIFSWVTWCFLSFCYLDYLVPCGLLILGIALPSLMLVLVDQNLLVFRERKKHTRLFHSMTSKAVASEIDRQKLSALGLEGKSATVTTLVCEMPALAALSSVLPPEGFIALVDECLELMNSAVHFVHGVVLRVDGSGITAVWGAPLEMDPARQSLLAMDCAWRIRDDLREYFSQLFNTGTIPMDPFPSLRIAIDTGQAVCGKLGAQDSETYAIVGQAVEFPAVYAKASSNLGAEFLAGEGTAALVIERFELRELDHSSLEEIYRNHKVYEVLGASGGVSGVREEAASLYCQALAQFRAGNIERCREFLVSALRMLPEDRPSLLLLDHLPKESERVVTSEPVSASAEPVLSKVPADD